MEWRTVVAAIFAAAVCVPGLTAIPAAASTGTNPVTFDNSGTAKDGPVVIAAVVVSTVSPNSGPTSGGTPVTITGYGLGEAAVTFGGTAAANLTASYNQLTVIAPAHAVGTVDITVTTPYETVTLTGGYTYTLPQTIDFPPMADTAFSATPPSPGAAATSGLPVTYSTATAKVCTITSAGVIRFLAKGKCVINADHPGDGSWSPAQRQQQSFRVAADNVTLKFLHPPKRIVVGQQVTFKLRLAAKSAKRLVPTRTTNLDTRQATLEPRQTGINGTAAITANGTPICAATIKSEKVTCTGKVTTTAKIIFTATFTGTVAGIGSTATTSVKASTGTVSIATANLEIKRCRGTLLFSYLTLTGYSTKPGSTITIWTKNSTGKTKLATTKTRRNGTWKYTTILSTINTKIQATDQKTKTPWQTTTKTASRGC